MRSHAAAVALTLSFASLSATSVARGSTPAAADRARSQAYYHFLMAKRAISANDYSRAIREFATARDLDPESVVVRAELAEVYLRLRRYRDAAREAEQATRLETDDEHVLRLLSRIFETTGDTDNALSVLERLVETHPEQGKYLVDLAAMLDKSGRAERATELLEQAVTRDPSATGAVFELVDRFRGQGRLDRAVEVLDAAAVESPTNLYVQSKLAELHLQMRDPVKAQESLMRMVEIEPENVIVLLEVARAFQGLEIHRQAANLYRRALELQPEDDAIRLNLATTLAMLNDARGALVEYRILRDRLGTGDDVAGERYELLKKIAFLEAETGNRAGFLEMLLEARPLARPADVSYHRMLARAHYLNDDPQEAFAILEEFNRGKDPGDPQAAEMFIGQAAMMVVADQVDAGLDLYETMRKADVLAVHHYSFMAHALLRAGRRTEAETVIRTAVQEAPEDEQRVFLRTASMLFEVDEEDLAFEQIERLVERYSLDRELQQYLARRYREEDRPKDAERVLKRAIEQFPDDADLHFAIGVTYEQMQDIDSTERALERAIGVNPKHALALNFLAYTWAERGLNLARAVDYAERAVALEPDNGAYLDSLGWANYKFGALTEARKNLERASKLREDPVILDHLGDVLFELGEAREALSVYERARALSARDAELHAAIGEKINRVGRQPGAAEEPTPRVD